MHRHTDTHFFTHTSAGIYICVHMEACVCLLYENTKLLDMPQLLLRPALRAEWDLDFPARNLSRIPGKKWWKQFSDPMSVIQLNLYKVTPTCPKFNGLLSIEAGQLELGERGPCTSVEAPHPK